MLTIKIKYEKNQYKLSIQPELVPVVDVRRIFDNDHDAVGFSREHDPVAHNALDESDLTIVYGNFKRSSSNKVIIKQVAEIITID
jgi:hypothetical protein